MNSLFSPFFSCIQPRESSSSSCSSSKPSLLQDAYVKCNVTAALSSTTTIESSGAGDDLGSVREDDKERLQQEQQRHDHNVQEEDDDDDSLAIVSCASIRTGNTPSSNWRSKKPSSLSSSLVPSSPFSYGGSTSALAPASMENNGARNRPHSTTAAIMPPSQRRPRQQSSPNVMTGTQNSSQNPIVTSPAQRHGDPYSVHPPLPFLITTVSSFESSSSSSSSASLSGLSAFPSSSTALVSHEEHEAVRPPPIWQPNPNDVLCGRGTGGSSNPHDGNNRFQQLVATQRAYYQSLISKKQKLVVARFIVDLIRGVGGRFLARGGGGNATSRGNYHAMGSTGWYDIGFALSLEKASQALCETPPQLYLSSLVFSSTPPPLPHGIEEAHKEHDDEAEEEKEDEISFLNHGMWTSFDSTPSGEESEENIVHTVPHGCRSRK